jgi:fructan beta-fructosidase
MRYSSVGSLCPQIQNRQSKIKNMLRPLYHYTPEKYWINDPNGLVYFNGEWHLFYQHNPFASEPNHAHWGHAVSRDLMHWDYLPIAIYEENGIMAFSGSAAVDWQNASGRGSAASPALIAAYTGHTAIEQDQRLAYSTDNGRTWVNAPRNPVIRLGLKDFRDPKLFWHEATQRWIMVCVLSDKQIARFFGSTDLQYWQVLSDFGPAGAVDGLWECPDLFPLAVDGDPANVKWVLKVDNSAPIDGHAGGQYFIGQFDGEKFICDDSPARIRSLDHALDFYAVQSWNDAPAGRHVWLAWLGCWYYGPQAPTAPWRGMMTAPRELALRTFADGIHLTQQPVNEIAALRKEHQHLAHVPASAATVDVQGTALDIDVTFEANGAAPFGVQVREGAAERTAIGYDPQAGELFVDRSASGNAAFSPRFTERHAVKLALRDHTLALRVLVDAQSVEVFADEGRVVLSVMIFPSDDSAGVSLFGDAQVKSMDVWRLG